MTLMTDSTARDAIYSLFQATWNAHAASIVGYSPEVRYQGIEHLDTPDPTKVWAHVGHSIVNTKQAGFSAAIARRYTTDGVLTVDIYAPRSASTAVAMAQQLANKLKLAFSGSRSEGVWYRNVTAAPAGNTDTYVVYRVMADFQYTEQGE